jgi:hypothetical protein
MSTTNSSAEKRTDSTDIRPATIPLGVDVRGRHHVWRRDRDRVHVIEPESGKRALVFDLDGDRLETWIEFVAEEDVPGWLDIWYGVRSVNYEHFRPRGF